MLAPDPAARPQTARHLLESVRRAREHSVRSGRAKAWMRGHRWRLLAVTALLVAAGGVWWKNWRGSPPYSASPAVAVLPFENLGPDPAEAFYAPGVQHEVAAGMARVAGWMVIDAGGGGFYPAASRDMSKVGLDLGATFLLEGSVRRAGGQVRVVVRLVDLRNLARPWKHTYQRPLAQAAALPGEITRTVADSLRVTLSARERAALDTPPTSRPAAYDLYLRAREEPDTPNGDAQRRLLQNRVALLDAAVADDPDFALAYCALAEAHDHLGALQVGADPRKGTVDQGALASAALDKAKHLRPEAGEVHLARAVHLRETGGQLEAARREIDLARQALPNDAEVEELAGEIARQQGRWEDAVRSLKRALALEPHRSASLFALAATDRLLRRYDDFDLTMHQLIEQVPAREAFTYRLYRALGPLESRADLAPLRAALAITPDDEPEKGSYAMILSLYAHDSRAPFRPLAGADKIAFWINGTMYPKAWFEALAAQVRGDEPGARASLTDTRVEIERAMTVGAADAKQTGFLAVVDALLGHREEAVQGGLAACKEVSTENPAADLPIAVGNPRPRLCLYRPARFGGRRVGKVHGPSRRIVSAGPTDLRRPAIKSPLGTLAW